MKLFIGARQSGKTSKMVELAKADPNGVILAADANRARHIRQTFNLPQSKVYSINSLSSDKLRGRNANYYIDDLDDYILHTVPGNVVAGTLTDVSVKWGLGEHEIRL